MIEQILESMVIDRSYFMGLWLLIDSFLGFCILINYFLGFWILILGFGVYPSLMFWGFEFWGFGFWGFGFLGFGKIKRKDESILYTIENLELFKNESI